MPKEVSFGPCTFAWLENKYGRFLSLNGQIHHEQYENIAYQPYIPMLLDTKEYDLFVDCGAYIGAFTMAGAFNCKKVISYEASPFLFGILLFNTRHKFNVDCRYAWIGKEGQIPMAKEEEIGMVTANRSSKYNIPVAELDSLLEIVKSHPKTLIKIDIEGNELNALEKATELLKRTYIHWVIDCHHQHSISVEDVLKFFPNRDVYNASNVLVVKGGLADPNDPMFKGWKRLG